MCRVSAVREASERFRAPPAQGRHSCGTHTSSHSKPPACCSRHPAKQRKFVSMLEHAAIEVGMHDDVYQCNELLRRHAVHSLSMQSQW